MNDLIRNAQHEAYERKAETPDVYVLHLDDGPLPGMSVVQPMPVVGELQELRDAIAVMRTEVYMLAQRLDEVERWQRDIYGEF